MAAYAGRWAPLNGAGGVTSSAGATSVSHDSVKPLQLFTPYESRLTHYYYSEQKVAS